MTEKIIDETVVQLPPKVTIGYSRKVNPAIRKGTPQYEGEEAQVFIEASFDTATPDEKQVTQAVKDAFNLAKAAVYDQLGVDYEFDPAQQHTVEKLQDAFPGTAVEKTTPRAPKSAVTSPAKTPAPDDKTPYWNQLEKEIAAGPVTIETKKGDVNGYPSFWDNRETAEGRQPQFKVRNTKAARDAGLEADVALWLSSAPEGFSTEPV